MIRIFVTIFAALTGLALGSFLNVCLSRWPEGESVVTPRSHCRSCTHTLAWWENLPLISWLALRGRCGSCHTPISCRYPLVELTVGVLWALAAWQLPERLELDSTPPQILALIALAMGWMIFDWLLVALAFLDAEYLWLPDALTLPGIVLGIVFTLAHQKLSGTVPSWVHIVAVEVGGILAAAGLVLLIRWVYWLIRRREGIGLGDAKLMALLAAWIGLPCALLSFGIAVLLGSVVAVGMLLFPLLQRPQNERARGQDMPPSWALTKLPLGTFLCCGGVISSLAGERLISAYLQWAGL